MAFEEGRAAHCHGSLWQYGDEFSGRANLFAESGLGVACIPAIAMHRQIDEGKLITLLDDHNQDCTTIRIL